MWAIYSSIVTEQSGKQLALSGIWCTLDSAIESDLEYQSEGNTIPPFEKPAFSSLDSGKLKKLEVCIIQANFPWLFTEMQIIYFFSTETFST